MNAERKSELDAMCVKFRKDVIELLHSIQTGHPGGSLSVCEILTALYFEAANVNPENPLDPDRDKVVLSKGHAAPMLYRVLAEKSYFPVSEMKTLRQPGSRLQGHPCSVYTPGVEVTSGPLGCAYGAALGIALADRLDGRENYVYAILGDGEVNEGVVWETVMNAVKQKADHFISILDWNGVQLDGTTDAVMPMGDLSEKFRAFGFNAIVVEDGHDIALLCEAIEAAKKTNGKPTVILAKTVKGKGVSFMEGTNIWHGRPIDDESYARAMKDLNGEGSAHG